jgi:ribosomal protein S18 acetylase RimI-like enzyme
MIKIRSLRASDLKQVLALLRQYTERESEYAILDKMRQLFIPFQGISQALPMHLQFLPSIFVAAAKQKVLGLIWLNRDGQCPHRWRIEHLILDPEASSYDIGTQLVNYVINRYGGEGVQTFLAYVDHYYRTGLDLLKTCGFRQCNRIHYFSHLNPTKTGLSGVTLKGIRESQGQDAEELANLYNMMLPPAARICMKKTSADFQGTLIHTVINRMKGLFFKRWVIEDQARDSLIAAIELSSVNYQDFSSVILINPGWEEVFGEVLTFMMQQVLLMTSNSRIHIECAEKNTTQIEVLEQMGFAKTSTVEVLVKDYWIPVESSGKPSPILLFSNGSNPAINLK